MRKKIPLIAREQKRIYRVCQVFCVSFLEKILWGGEPPRL